MDQTVRVSNGHVSADISNDHDLREINYNTQSIISYLSDILKELVKLNAKFDECAMVVRKSNGQV